MSKDLDYLLLEIRKARDYAEESVILGGAKDYLEYRIKCTEIRVLNDVELLIKERFKQLEGLHDE